MPHTLQSNPPLPLLITGITGVAGFNALHYFQRRFPGQVIGIRQQDNWRLKGPGIVACNAEDRDGLRRLFEEYRFAAVLDCAGNCALKSCELDPQMAWRINVLGVRNLVMVAREFGARVVHLSIDLVFSGVGHGNHAEHHPTDPVTVYGKTMVAGEQVVLAELPNACTLRISLPMGVSFNGHAGAIDWIQSRFKQNKPATLYYDEVRTPTYTDCLDRLFRRVLASKLTGLYHAGAPRQLSLYEIAQIVNRVGGYDPELLRGCLRQQAGPIPPRAGNVTMDSSKLTVALGHAPFDPWPVDEHFVPTHRHWHSERPAGEAGSPQLLAQLLYRNPRRAAKMAVTTA
jgi:dTDP-4-dehydrorhamnose reductase